MAGLSELLVQNDQIAQQNNPNFAALNAAVLGQFAPYEGFGEFVQKTLEPFRQRAHTSQENLLNRQHTSSENLLSRQHDAAQNDLTRKHQALENKLAHERTLARDAVLNTYNTARDNAAHGRALELNQKQHDYNKDLYKYQTDIEQQKQNNLRRLNLENMYVARGGTKDPKTMTDLELQQANYSLSNQPGSTQPLQTNTGAVPDFKENSTTETGASGSDQGLLINPPTSVGGSITVDDLPNLAEKYPYLSSTPEGRAFLAEVKAALINNRENIQALQPLVDRFNSGEFSLRPSIPEYTASFNVPKNSDKVRWKNSIGNWDLIIPDFIEDRIRYMIGNPNLTAAEAREYGISTPRQETQEYADNFIGYAQKGIDNYIRNQLADYNYKKAEQAFKALGRMGAKQIDVSPNDNVLNEARRNISAKLGIYDPEAVLTFVDGNGSFVFTVNGHLFRMNNGLVYEVKY